MIFDGDSRHLGSTPVLASWVAPGPTISLHLPLGFEKVSGMAVFDHFANKKFIAEEASEGGRGMWSAGL